MLANYLKVAMRSIRHNKLVTLINLSGLALAFVCVLLIALFVDDEFKYDRHHANADHIYRVTRNFLSPDGSVSLHLGHVAPPFAPLLENDFPDIRETARVLQAGIQFSVEEEGVVKVSFDEEKSYFAEPSVLNIFTIPLLAGDRNTALQQPFTILVSDRMAQRYFGTLDVVGKHLKGDQLFNLEITGVFESFPAQSHWHPEFMIAFSTLESPDIYGRTNLETNYGNNSFATYLLVNDTFDAKKTEAAFPAFLDRHMGAAMGPNATRPSTFTNLFLQPLTSIHLHSHLDSEVEANGNIRYVTMIIVVGFFILLIACFNFINLSTARATKRAREVGLRKVVGAVKRQLVTQFLGESVLMALMALLIATMITPMALHWLNAFTGKSIQLNPIDHAPGFIIAVFAAVLVGAVAGVYPAFVLAAFKPAFILKGRLMRSANKWSLRKVLVTAQFAISIVLVIATFVIMRQLKFMESRDLGYQKDLVVTLPYYTELDDHYEAFYDELTRHSAVQDAARSSRIPTGRLLDSQGTSIQQGDSAVATAVVIKNVGVDHSFFETYNIPLVSGRNFSKDIQSDDSLAFILNETAAAMIGWSADQAVGQVFINGGVKGQVIGVAKDFHFESLHEPIVPIVFQQHPAYRRLSVSLSGQDVPTALGHMETIWKRFLPQRNFEFRFLNDLYRQLYTHEEKQSELFMVFSFLALFIASLGLFGLTTYSTQQRTKEIGIRKVMGASVQHILKILTTEILLLILLANAIAWPVAWYFMRTWLDGFAYHIGMPVAAFLVAGVAGMLLALFTVSTQTLKAATSNPAQTLRQDA